MNIGSKESYLSSSNSSGGNPSGSSDGIISRCDFTDGGPFLFGLVQQLKWRKLCRLLKRRKGKKLCKQRDHSGLSLLGIALGFHAPIDTIKLILETDPKQILQKDVFGANPLHIACLNGASIDIIKLLIDTCGKDLVVNAYDNDSRTPLHQSVECICRNEIEFLEGCRVIYALLAVEDGADMLHHQDAHGDTPLSIVYLKMNHYDCMDSERPRLDHLYDRLLEYSSKLYASKKRMWELAGYCQQTHSAKTFIPAPLFKKNEETSAKTASTDSFSSTDSDH